MYFPQMYKKDNDEEFEKKPLRTTHTRWSPSTQHINVKRKEGREYKEFLLTFFLDVVMKKKEVVYLVPGNAGHFLQRPPRAAREREFTHLSSPPPRTPHPFLGASGLAAGGGKGQNNKKSYTIYRFSKNKKYIFEKSMDTLGIPTRLSSRITHNSCFAMYYVLLLHTTTL